MGRKVRTTCPICKSGVRFDPAEQNEQDALMLHQYGPACTHGERPRERTGTKTSFREFTDLRGGYE